MDFRTIALSIQQFVPDLATPVVKLMINKRYQQIMRYRDWEYLKASITTGTSPTISSGTSCNISYGNTLVTSNDQSGNSFYAHHASWWIRFESESQPYEISSVTDTSRLVISAPYSGTTAGLTGVSFTLFKPDYVSGVSMTRIESMYYQSPLRERPIDWLHRRDPEMTDTGTPIAYGIVSQNQNKGRVRYRLYPITSDASYGIKIYYMKKVDNLSSDTDIPLCSPELLEAWAMYDCYKIASIKNPTYLRLLQEQKVEYKEILHDEIQADLRIASLPPTVREVGNRRYVSSEYALDHDVDTWD